MDGCPQRAAGTPLQPAEPQQHFGAMAAMECANAAVGPVPVRGMAHKNPPTRSCSTVRESSSASSLTQAVQLREQQPSPAAEKRVTKWFPCISKKYFQAVMAVTGIFTVPALVVI